MKLRAATGALVSTALLALVAAGCGGTGADSAESQPLTTAAAPAPQAGAHDPARLVQRFDTNGDGALQLTELPARMQAHLGAADADHDGVLAPAEMTAFAQAHREARFAQADKNGDGAITADEAGERAWTFVSRADADHDGRVTRAELEQAWSSHALRGPQEWHHGFRAHDPARLVQRFDANGDGALQLSELPPRMQAHLGAADADHDGVLSATELAAAAPHAPPALEAPAADAPTQL